MKQIVNMIVNLLLTDDAKRAKKIIRNYKPEFSTKEDLFVSKDLFNRCEDRLVYADGVVRAKID